MTTTTRSVVFCFLLAALILACSGRSHAAEASSVISKTEWTVFLQQNAALKTADAKLNATYKAVMTSLPRAEKNALLEKQRAWIAGRNEKAFAAHAKGSPEYLAMIEAATLEREKELREAYLNKPSSPPKAQPAPAAEETQTAREDDLTVKVAPQKSRRKVTPINVTPKTFAESYNAIAYRFRAPSFPLVPAGVSTYSTSRTEEYPIAAGISIQFRYANNDFDKPGTITFLAHDFANGTAAHKDNIAYALVGLLKSLGNSPAKDEKAKDAEIFGFMHSINNAFTSDASRVWKNDGLVYVITYLKKNDLFAMVVTADDKRKQ